MVKVLCNESNCKYNKDDICQREELNINGCGFYGEITHDMIKCFKREGNKTTDVNLK